MLNEPNAEQNTAFSIIPTVHPVMPWRVANVRPLPDFRLQVTFNDGLEGIVDMQARVHAKTAGVFSTLADSKNFKAVSVQFGAVTWENGVDLAPDAMYEAIKAHGEWILT